LSYLVEVLLAAAEDARARGDDRGARLRFSEVLKADPANLSARHGLALLDEPALETTVASDGAGELEPTVASDGYVDELQETKALAFVDELEETKAMPEADELEETVASDAVLERTVVSERAPDESPETEPALELDLPEKKRPPTRAKAIGTMRLAKKSAAQLNAARVRPPRGADAIFGPARPPRYLGVEPAGPRVRPGFLLALLLAAGALAVLWPTL